MGAFDILKQNHLGLQLTEIGVTELTLLDYAPCDVFVYENNAFRLALTNGTEVTRDTLKNLIHQGFHNFFVPHQGQELIKTFHQSELRNCTRALSIGDPLKNALKTTTYLCINMGHIYKDPADNGSLVLQFQSAKNLASFLIDNSKLIEKVYKDFPQDRFHYIITQPLYSSLLLLGFLKYTFHFSKREMELLFLASYFKDIGMALIPRDRFEKENLDSDEKKSITDHTVHSLRILDNRVPFGPSYLSIIENHHQFSLLKPINEDSQESAIYGIETLFVNIMDTISAMTHNRPYRQSIGIYQSLDLIKNQISVYHPQEYKHLIMYFQKFFSR